MEKLAQLLDKYRAGTATPEELRKLMALLTEGEADVRAFLEKEYTVDVAQSPMEDRAEGILRKLHKQIDERELLNGPEPKVIRPYFRAIAWVAAAAVGALLCLGLWMHDKDGKAPVPVSIAEVGVTDSSRLEQLANNTGLPRDIRLDDGSRVVLYPGSTLSYKQPFERLERNINMKGKALFKVKGDIMRPFTVMAAGTATTALGTEFMINTRPAGKMVSVKLIAGKVAVRVTGTSNEAAYLKPGEEFTLDNIRHKITILIPGKPGDRRDSLTAGQAGTGTLSFSKEPLSNVFSALEKFYKVKINCKGKVIDGLSFTGEFYPSDSLDAVLAAICNTNDLAFKKTPDDITIISNK